MSDEGPRPQEEQEPGYLVIRIHELLTRHDAAPSLRSLRARGILQPPSQIIVPVSKMAANTQELYAQIVPSGSRSIDFNAARGRHSKITPTYRRFLRRKPCPSGSVFSRAHIVSNSRVSRAGCQISFFFSSHQVSYYSTGVPRCLLQPNIALRHRQAWNRSPTLHVAVAVDLPATPPYRGNTASNPSVAVCLDEGDSRRRIAAPHTHLHTSILTCLLLALPLMYAVRVVISCLEPTVVPSSGWGRFAVADQSTTRDGWATSSMRRSPWQRNPSLVECGTRSGRMGSSR